MRRKRLLTSSEYTVWCRISCSRQHWKSVTQLPWFEVSQISPHSISWLTSYISHTGVLDLFLAQPFGGRSLLQRWAFLCRLLDGSSNRCTIVCLQVRWRKKSKSWKKISRRSKTKSTMPLCVKNFANLSTLRERYMTCSERMLVGAHQNMTLCNLSTMATN